MSFLFSGLGMMIFWGFYVLFGLVVGIYVGRFYFKKELDYLLGKSSSWYKGDLEIFIPACIFWPFTLVIVLLLLSLKILLYGFKRAFFLVDKIMPEIEIKKKDD